MDLPALLAAAGGLKTAGELVTGIVKAKNQSDVTAKAIELQSVIIGLQSSIFDTRDALSSLQEENRQLKESAMRREHFGSDMARYALTPIRPGSVAYALKQSMSNGEPPHYICANCYQNGKKVTLSCGAYKELWYAFICPTCKVAIATGYRGPSEAQYAPENP